MFRPVPHFYFAFGSCRLLQPVISEAQLTTPECVELTEGKALRGKPKTGSTRCQESKRRCRHTATQLPAKAAHVSAGQTGGKEGRGQGGRAHPPQLREFFFFFSFLLQNVRDEGAPAHAPQLRNFFLLFFSRKMCARRARPPNPPQLRKVLFWRSKQTPQSVSLGLWHACACACTSTQKISTDGSK